jgi:hypothetical protein
MLTFMLAHAINWNDAWMVKLGRFGFPRTWNRSRSGPSATRASCPAGRCYGDDRLEDVDAWPDSGCTPFRGEKGSC